MNPAGFGVLSSSDGRSGVGGVTAVEIRQETMEEGGNG